MVIKFLEKLFLSFEGWVGMICFGMVVSGIISSFRKNKNNSDDEDE